MSETAVLFIVAQAIAIVVMLIGIYVKLSGQLREITITLVHLETRRSEQREDHGKLDEQVQGLSCHVERHDTLLEVRDVIAAKPEG